MISQKRTQLHKSVIAMLVCSLLAAPIATQAASTQPHDKYYFRQWGISNTGESNISERYSYFNITPQTGIDINITPVMEDFTSENEVIVAVIDTGVDYQHEDLTEHMWTNSAEIPGNGIDDDNNGYIDDIYGWNFYNGNSQVCSYGPDGAAAPNNDDNHGTHVAGTIAAAANDIGIIGVASTIPVKIMSLKVAGGPNGQGATSNVIKAIRYADSMGASVCNISLNSSKYNDALMQTMQASDMLFICSAGNTTGSGMNIDEIKTYPAAYELPNVIAVAALQSDGQIAPYSNYGTETVSLAAPGTNIFSTYVGNRYDYRSGTSMAAPFVTGAAAILQAAKPGLYAAEYRALLEDSVQLLPGLDVYTRTGGLLDVSKALTDTLAYSPIEDSLIPVIKASAAYNSTKKTGSIRASATDAGGSCLKAVRYAMGQKTAAFFADGTKGLALTNGTASISKAGFYTLYAVDHAGNETIRILEIK